MQLLSGKIESKIAGVSSTPLSLINPIFSRGENQMTAKTVSKRCSISDCIQRYYAKGFCAKHYTRALKHGDPHITNRGVGNTPQQRFWSKVCLTSDVNRCWEWQGGKYTDGYGSFYFEGKNYVAHRLAWFFVYGVHPTLWLLHSCDNPPCVNPYHLREGTHQENMADRRARPRAPKSLKLTTAQVFAIQVDKRRLKDIAAEYGVCMSVISCIRTGKRRLYI